MCGTGAILECKEPPEEPIRVCGVMTDGLQQCVVVNQSAVLIPQYAEDILVKIQVRVRHYEGMRALQVVCLP